jgi:hypothetical protein
MGSAPVTLLFIALFDIKKVPYLFFYQPGWQNENKCTRKNMLHQSTQNYEKSS